MVTEKWNRIKDVLKEKGKTQVWLTENMGISKAAVNDLCANRTQPSLKRLREIAEILQVEPAELIEPMGIDGDLSKGEEIRKCLSVIEEMTGKIRKLTEE